jgi:uncharacterized protein YcbX
VKLRGGDPCTRCKAVTLDYYSLEFDADYEPVKTLITHRNYTKQGCFGHLFFRDNNGKIKVGDEIEVSKYKKLQPIKRVKR